MIFHGNRLLADDSHEISCLIFFQKFAKMPQNLSSTAVVIGSIWVKPHTLIPLAITSGGASCFDCHLRLGFRTGGEVTPSSLEEPVLFSKAAILSLTNIFSLSFSLLVGLSIRGSLGGMVLL